MPVNTHTVAPPIGEPAAYKFFSRIGYESRQNMVYNRKFQKKEIEEVIKPVPIIIPKLPSPEPEPEPEPEHEARTTELIIISFHSKSNSFLNIILSRALEICPEYQSSMQLHF